MHRLLPAIALAVLAPAASLRATWSILLADLRTGEIAIGSATCLAGFDLRAITPVLRVGIGAATAQAAVNPGSITNRALIWRQLAQGVAPSGILAALAAQDPRHQTRQYGILDVQGRTATFTGSSTMAWAGGVTGQIGTIVYAIQGNILTGPEVVQAAEQAVRTTAGDLAEKLMAAMQAARAFGGDGRCSCSVTQPTSCGAPPPSFTKSAHIGFMIVARQGDPDGECGVATIGCASGSYWMNLNVAFQPVSAPDPVAQLQTLFDAWRLTLAGRPDHHLSAVALDPLSLLPDGQTTAQAVLKLRDWQGTPLGVGGATVQVTLDSSSTAPVSIGPVVDRGDGTYAFTLTAGTVAGTARLRITVDDGQGAILLSPRTEVELRQDPLWAQTALLSAAAGGSVDFTLNAGSGAAGLSYALAMTGSGTMPGAQIGPVLLPLNPDPLLAVSVQLANSSVFVNTIGVLDGAGRANAQLAVPGAGFLGPLVGTDLDFAYLVFNPLTSASNPVRVQITP